MSAPDALTLAASAMRRSERQAMEAVGPSAREAAESVADEARRTWREARDEAKKTDGKDFGATALRDEVLAQMRAAGYPLLVQDLSVHVREGGQIASVTMNGAC